MKTIDKKQIWKMVLTVMGTILLVLISAFAVSGTVLSQGNNGSREQKAYYKSLEHEHVKSIRGFLEEQGYVDSGVTMNRVIEADGSMSYTVTIHHKRILELEPAQRDELALSCSDLEFPIEDCNLCYTFLQTSF